MISKFAKEIFKLRYAQHSDETFEEACLRVSSFVARAEKIDHLDNVTESFNNLLINNLFSPGGRIWYGAGRFKPALLNCFACSTEDSRAGWGKLISDFIVISGMGGGLGINFSNIRPKGFDIRGTGGKSSGSVSLMKIVNSAAEEIKGGGERRAACLFCLDYKHPDIMEFLDIKLNLKQLNNANISIIIDEEFIAAVKEDKEITTEFNNLKKYSYKAKDFYDRIITNALNTGEPGIINLQLANRYNNIFYAEDIVSTNPCFSPDTLVTTREGVRRIDSLVDKSITIHDGVTWVTIDNFRITGINKELLCIVLNDGSEIKVTENHSIILSNGTRVEAKSVKVGDTLLSNNIECSGETKDNLAYLKGFLIGDGNIKRDSAVLMLYFPKFICKEKLESLGVTFSSLNVNRYISRQLPLVDWVTRYKSEFPLEVFNYNKESIYEFIAGIFDSDGTALDSTHGFGYQLTSINKGWLLTFQSLLKSIGVFSNVRLMKKRCFKYFNKGKKEYLCKDCYRLVISQESSIYLSKQVPFIRLKSFKDRVVKHLFDKKYNRVVSINKIGISEKVYCCTVPNSHSITLGNGILIGQCGEMPMAHFQSCDLGSLVLPSFVNKGEFDWQKLAEAIPVAVRFLDNVLDVTEYPLKEIEETTKKYRRIGLGVMGLHDTLLLLGMRYCSKQSLEFIDKLFGFIKKKSYEASTYLSVEKGVFPLFRRDDYLRGNFIRELPVSIRTRIKQYGIRNSALLTCAPTGTTSIISECSSGIEPIYSFAYRRRFYSENASLKDQIVIHPLFKKFVLENKSLKNFQHALEIPMSDHLTVQSEIQRHIDGAISKTINIGKDFDCSDSYSKILDILPTLKGITLYREGSRGESPLEPLSIEEAKEYINKEHLEETTESKCKTGVCDL